MTEYSPLRSARESCPVRAKGLFPIVDNSSPEGKVTRSPLTPRPAEIGRHVNLPNATA